MIYSPFATRLTVFGERDMTNRKPFRSAAGKKVARAMAEVVDGTHVSDAQRSLHPDRPFTPNKPQRRHAADYYQSCGEFARAVAALNG